MKTLNYKDIKKILKIIYLVMVIFGITLTIASTTNNFIKKDSVDSNSNNSNINSKINNKINSNSNSNGNNNEKTVNAKSIKYEPLKSVNFKKTKYSPKIVKMNSTDIYVFGAYPTRKRIKYQRYDVHLKNYFEGKWGKLKFEIHSTKKGYKKGFSPVEGMFFYDNKKSKCHDVDFDIVTGESHDSKNFNLKVISRKKSKYN
ncbi:MAG: hypothetical protein LBM96_12740 [Methanobrevibacter sp.]|jgi:hypothetical protein|nr:hypothetical protein [Candidatus Methanoflexus mossambicus]